MQLREAEVHLGSDLGLGTEAGLTLPARALGVIMKLAEVGGSALVQRGSPFVPSLGTGASHYPYHL